MTPFTVVVASGGLDSTVLAYDLARNGHHLLLLSFDYAQRHRREIQSAIEVARLLKAKHTIVDAQGIGVLLNGSALTDGNVEVPEGNYSHETMSSTVVPNRNAIFLSVAIGVAAARGASAVAFAAHTGDYATYPDCRPNFVEAANNLARISTKDFGDVGVIAPLVGLSKSQIVEHGQRLGVPFELTWSCYQGKERHCGACSTCWERRGAFEKLNMADPTIYADQVVH